MKQKISIIVAVDNKNGIGKNDKLPWHIPSELKRFKEITTGHPIIMGRKTYESIGRPLPNRTNIIITRDANLKIKDCIITHSLEEALEKAKSIEKEEIFVIGGAQVYEQALPQADKLYLTVVEGEYDTDTFFPDYSDFKKVVFKQPQQDENHRFTYLDLEK